MISCQECKEQLYPQDPSKSFGGFRPLCYSCPDFDYEKEVLEKPLEKEYVILNKEQRGQLQQIHGEVFYLRNRLREHLDASRKRKDRL